MASSINGRLALSTSFNPWLDSSQQTVEGGNGFLSGREDLAQFVLGFFQFRLLCLAIGDELIQGRLHFGLGRLGVDGLLQSFGFRTGRLAEGAASTLLVAAIIIT